MDEEQNRITPQHPCYRMTQHTEWYNVANEEPEDSSQVNTVLKDWSDFGWELVSATATTIMDKYVRYVMYWRNPLRDPSGDRAGGV